MKQVPIEQIVGAAGGTMTVQKDGSTKFHLSATSLQWLVDYVRSIENEACAKLCGELHLEGEDNTGLAADLIRARGNHGQT